MDERGDEYIEKYERSKSKKQSLLSHYYPTFESSSSSSSSCSEEEISRFAQIQEFQQSGEKKRKYRDKNFNYHYYYGKKHSDLKNLVKLYVTDNYQISKAEQIKAFSWLKKIKVMRNPQMKRKFIKKGKAQLSRYFFNANLNIQQKKSMTQLKYTTEEESPPTSKDGSNKDSEHIKFTKAGSSTSLQRMGSRLKFQNGLTVFDTEEAHMMEETLKDLSDAEPGDDDHHTSQNSPRKPYSSSNINELAQLRHLGNWTSREYLFNDLDRERKRTVYLSRASNPNFLEKLQLDAEKMELKSNMSDHFSKFSNFLHSRRSGMSRKRRYGLNARKGSRQPSIKIEGSRFGDEGRSSNNHLRVRNQKVSNFFQPSPKSSMQKHSIFVERMPEDDDDASSTPRKSQQFVRPSLRQNSSASAFSQMEMITLHDATSMQDLEDYLDQKETIYRPKKYQPHSSNQMQQALFFSENKTKFAMEKLDSENLSEQHDDDKKDWERESFYILSDRAYMREVSKKLSSGGADMLDFIKESDKYGNRSRFLKKRGAFLSMGDPRFKKFKSCYLRVLNCIQAVELLAVVMYYVINNSRFKSNETIMNTTAYPIFAINFLYTFVLSIFLYKTNKNLNQKFKPRCTMLFLILSNLVFIASSVLLEKTVSKIDGLRYAQLSLVVLKHYYVDHTLNDFSDALTPFKLFFMNLRVYITTMPWVISLSFIFCALSLYFSGKFSEHGNSLFEFSFITTYYTNPEISPVLNLMVKLIKLVVPLMLMYQYLETSIWYHQKNKVKREHKKLEKVKEMHRELTQDVRVKQYMSYDDRADLFQELMFLKSITHLKQEIRNMEKHEKEISLFCHYMNYRIKNRLKKIIELRAREKLKRKRKQMRLEELRKKKAAAEGSVNNNVSIDSSGAEPRNSSGSKGSFHNFRSSYLGSGIAMKKSRFGK